MNKKTTKTTTEKKAKAAPKAKLESANREILKLVKNELGAILGYEESPKGLKLLKGKITSINIKLNSYDEYNNTATFDVVNEKGKAFGEVEMDFDELYALLEHDAIKIL